MSMNACCYFVFSCCHIYGE